MTERWVLASANAGKLSELAALLAELDIEVVSQAAFNVPDAVEDGVAFVDNALIKARHAAAATGLPAIADDSGLAVDYLDGAPGIRSARFAGTHGDDAASNAALLEALAGVPDSGRGAAFHCCLVATRAADDPVPVIAQGVWRGRILSAPRGDGGFGYDPLFWATEENASAAELTAERKNAVSHRGRAMATLIDRFRERR
ncbi:RdgB/HAM1 family non-canonical purine NTP pyrophosphatase [Salinisphaera sp. LB1]|uniref:RdgB/HAM1 family non-canonical purine NTP pyrophosphatase n=1 Tax=Salinisphaera sp. LB1 TaxID=2183911 RepID=UPI000D7053A6|nr:RdgB/HAM1 family non-canonical purine NTP pyrophosphatase [Salinisphaera sp. LB1]AWN14634.1 Nucleoside 5-triphosphatase RdgB (dHAPTP, dITP, XTP-specific) [Salinisphaera sp. LB1]